MHKMIWYVSDKLFLNNRGPLSDVSNVILIMAVIPEFQLLLDRGRRTRFPDLPRVQVRLARVGKRSRPWEVEDRDPTLSHERR